MISKIEITKTIFDNDTDDEDEYMRKIDELIDEDEYMRKIDELIENDRRSYENIFAEDDEDEEYMRKIDELIENDRLYYLEK